MNNLVLSIFPGIDLLGRAFEEEGFCVVRGPDVLWGGDIRNFHPSASIFRGVIGGPPCQAFSRLRWLNPLSGKKHGNLIPEFERVVAETSPEWWLMENVREAPEPVVLGYQVQHFILNNRWLGAAQQRIRRFSFGTKSGHKIVPEVAIFETIESPVTVLAGHGPVGRGGEQWKVPQKVPDMCRLQGLPENFTDDMPFTVSGKKSVIGNAVPLSMGKAIAKAIKEINGGNN